MPNDMTVMEWRQRRALKPWKFFDLKRQGRVPVIINGRITAKHDLAWEKSEIKRANSAAERRKAERKRAQTQAAGRIAAQSPLFVSNRKKHVL